MGYFVIPSKDTILRGKPASYPGGGQFYKKGISGGRGFGLFMAARLDYVEKLQNYDWVIADVNIFDVAPGIENGGVTRNQKFLDVTFKELTRLMQEHYILGYPYPLAEVHNFISLKKNFKEEIVNRLKYSLYKDQQMDNVDIENLFLDTRYPTTFAHTLEICKFEILWNAKGNLIRIHQQHRHLHIELRQVRIGNLGIVNGKPGCTHHIQTCANISLPRNADLPFQYKRTQ
jgi:hypothetical protein